MRMERSHTRQQCTPFPGVTHQALGSRWGSASCQAWTPQKATFLEKGRLRRRVQHSLAQGLSILPGACQPYGPF